MSQIIKFTNTWGTEDIFPPEPASKHIPDWYKNLESYTGGERKPSGQGGTSATIKRCMPVFDVMNAGYILRTPADIFISQKETFDENGNSLGIVPYYEWSNFGLITFHPIIQAPNHPFKRDLSEYGAYPKLENPWIVKTPPGYSCLFVPPFHKESIINVLPGLVDTDSYANPVNFPFVLNDWSFTGLVPAGTEIVQVIPFKRDDFEMQMGTQEDIEDHRKINMKLRTRFFDSYKNQFRATKSYK